MLKTMTGAMKIFLHIDNNNSLTLLYLGPPDKLRKWFESIRRHSVETRQTGSTNLERMAKSDRAVSVAKRRVGVAGSERLTAAVCYECRRTWARVPGARGVLYLICGR